MGIMSVRPSGLSTNFVAKYSALGRPRLPLVRVERWLLLLLLLLLLGNPMTARDPGDVDLLLPLARLVRWVELPEAGLPLLRVHPYRDRRRPSVRRRRPAEGLLRRGRVSSRHSRVRC